MSESTDGEINFDATTHYELLNVDSSASPEEIKKQTAKYKNTYHPDRNSDSTTEKFTRINKAINVLTDAEKKQEYDERKIQLHLDVEPSIARVNEEINITVTSELQENTQYLISTNDGSVEKQTDGNGEVTISFETPGEKILLANKIDEGTTQYLEGTKIIKVREKEERRLTIELHSLSRDAKIERGESVSTGEEIKALTRDSISGNIVNDVTITINGELHATTMDKSFVPNEPGTYEIICEGNNDQQITYKPTKRELTVTPSSKELTAKVYPKNKVTGEKIHVETYADGTREPRVTIEIQHGEDIKYRESDEDGVYEFTVSSAGPYTIKLQKDGEYESSSKVINVSENNSRSSIGEQKDEVINIEIDTPTEGDFFKTKAEFDIHIDGVIHGEKQKTAQINLLNVNKYGEGELVESETLYLAGELDLDRHFKITSDGTYRLTIDVDGERKAVRTTDVTGLDSAKEENNNVNTDTTSQENIESAIENQRDNTPNIREYITNGVKRVKPHSNVTNGVFITSTPKSYLGKFGVLVVYFYSWALLQGITLPQEVMIIAVTAMLAVPLFIPRVGWLLHSYFAIGVVDIMTTVLQPTYDGVVTLTSIEWQLVLAGLSVTGAGLWAVLIRNTD